MFLLVQSLFHTVINPEKSSFHCVMFWYLEHVHIKMTFCLDVSDLKWFQIWSVNSLFGLHSMMSSRLFVQMMSWQLITFRCERDIFSIRLSGLLPKQPNNLRVKSVSRWIKTVSAVWNGPTSCTVLEVSVHSDSVWYCARQIRFCLSDYFLIGHFVILSSLWGCPATGQGFQDVTAPSQEIVWHKTPHNTTICHFYTLIQYRSSLLTLSHVWFSAAVFGLVFFFTLWRSDANSWSWSAPALHIFHVFLLCPHPI